MKTVSSDTSNTKLVPRRTFVRHCAAAYLTLDLFRPTAASTGKLGNLAYFEGRLADIIDFESNQTVVWKYTDMVNVYLIDFNSLFTQGRTFNRITHLMQQAFEPYKKILTESELNTRLNAVSRSMETMAFGHDVLFDELALFFNLANRDGLQLFQEEAVLLEFLKEAKILTEWRGIYSAPAPNGVILSAPQIQKKIDGSYIVSPLARKTIVTHELAHAEYYTNPYYAEYCRRYWSESLNNELRSVFLEFLKKYNYSLYGTELVINEMQAYLMFTPDPKSFSAKILGVSDTTLRAMRAAFAAGNPPTRLPLNLSI